MTQTDVLIVGAGPTGLMMANQLIRRNINHIIIDKNSGPSVATKALGVQARTLEIYDHLGIADKAVEMGTPGDGASIHVKGKLVAELPFGEVGSSMSRYPYLLILGQDDNEKLLGEVFRSKGGEVQWRTELVALEQNSTGVFATVKKSDGSMDKIEAKYVAGCDGGKSTVRQLSNIDFVGAPYEQVFFLADTTATGPMVQKRLNVYMWKNGFHLFFPLRGNNHWRIAGILPVEQRHKDDLKFEAVVPSITREAGSTLSFKECNWFSTYRIHHRRAAKFREKRCFLMGDAAHVHSPVGAQGMNTGLQDAYNLAWKLALVISDKADEKLLNSYEQERIPVAERLLKTTDSMFTAIVSNGWFARMFRTQIYPKVIAFVMGTNRLRRLAFRTISQLNIHYPQSSLSQNLNGLGKKSPQAGDRFPWLHLKFSSNSAAEDVFKKFGDSNFTLVTFGHNAPLNLDNDYGGLVRVFQIPDDPANSSELRRVNIPNQSFYLIRQDGYIGLTGSVFESGTLGNYFRERISFLK